MSSGRLLLGLACFFIPAFRLAAELPVPAFDVGYAEAQSVTPPVCAPESGGECDCPACQAAKKAA